MKLEFVGHSFAYVVHFEFLKDVWIRTQRAAVASRRATNLATHLSNVIFVLCILKLERSDVVFDFHYLVFGVANVNVPSALSRSCKNPFNVDEI
jgi:hypothetical protein